MTRLILLDRDGVINQDSDAYVKSVLEFVPIPGSIEAIAELHRFGFKIGICTNQSALGRGLMSEAALSEIHVELCRRITGAGGRVDALHYCPHLPDAGCNCRKPQPGMLEAVMAELNEAADHTVFVGDSLRDLEAAAAAQVRAVLVRTGNGARVEARARAMGIAEVYDDLSTFAAAEIARCSDRGPRS